MPEAELHEPADVDRVYEELKRAIDRDARDPAAMRALAERFWPVSADKPLERRPGAKGWVAFQVKRVLRKLDALVRRAGLRRAADRQRRAAPARRRALAAGRRARAHDEARGLHAAGAVRARRHRDLRGRARAGAARARARGRARHRAVQVVSGRARADAGVPLAAARPRGGERPADRRGDRDEVPVVRRAASAQGRVAAAPVPAGVGSRPHRARPVLRVGGGPRAAAQGARVRPRRARRGAQDLHDVVDRRRPAARLDRARSGRACAAARAARVPLHGVRGLHPLGEPARPREADRPADRSGGAGARCARRDRRRRARSRAARAARARRAGSTAARRSPAA